MDKHQNLLKQVGFLLNSYNKLAKITGENFNIFSVMGMESNEVKTHSAIIGHLLDPNGSHGLDNIPLELFIKQIIPNSAEKEPSEEENLILNRFNLDIKSCQVKIEEHVGKISDDYSEGGRIDVVVKDNVNGAIIIENKIYAEEQKKQLVRYSKAYPNAPIIFLTLDGHDSTSTNDINTVIDVESNKKLEINKDYFLMSYEKDILEWLENCLKEAVKFPMLREVLQQYIYLIKKLTHQTTNAKMKKEITTLIKDNYLESTEIYNNFINVKLNILADFWDELAESVKTKIDNSKWEVKINNKFFTGNFNFLLIHEKGKESIYFYYKYNIGMSSNFVTFHGIVLNPKLLAKYKGSDICKELNLAGNPGKTSVIYNTTKLYNLNDDNIIAELLSETSKKKIIDNYSEKIKDFISEEMHVFDKISKYIDNAEKK
jgi:hypothetical protein